VINNQFFFTSSIDNCIDLWIMNKKRPIFTLENLHSPDSWILSTANVRNSDLFCSGSYDGQIIFYRLNKDKKNFEVARRLRGFNGCINNMKFSNIRGQDFSNLMLAVTHSKEERLGRWHVQPHVKDGISIVKRTSVA
jgi:WD40 repeat protein